MSFQTHALGLKAFELERKNENSVSPCSLFPGLPLLLRTLRGTLVGLEGAGVMM